MSKKTAKEDTQEYAVIKDFISKTDEVEYRIGSKILLGNTRAVTLTNLGFINAIPVAEV